jgi:signal transduction histidine kinase
VEFDGAASQRLPDETEHESYRLAQKALNNVVMHANARRVGVRLELDPHAAKLEVVDDGIAFDPSSTGGGFSTSRMRESAAQLAGVLHVESERGSGTVVRVEVPR